MSVAIKVENVSKQYRLGKVGTGTFGHDLNRWWHLMRGKDDPYLKIGEVNDRTVKGDINYVWALREINFEIEQGQAVGIIGRNGAGKSTLLKILSRTTSPTIGTVRMKGRVASLLEVGTGFHPELSGRDNIFLNGAILGMTRKEIFRKFDEIVDFAGVERYIDTPVKRYSSGMYVRLAFAVAAHLESEILIVDEVLAVGDAEFQKKCLGKMGTVSKGEGRTVLYVSHNLLSIMAFCDNSILLNNGCFEMFSDSINVINKYKKLGFANNKYEFPLCNIDFDIIDVSITNNFGLPDLMVGEEVIIVIDLIFKNSIKNVAFELFVSTEEELVVFSGYSEPVDVSVGTKKVTCVIPKRVFNNITYKIAFGVSKNYLQFLGKFDNLIEFEVNDSPRGFGWQGKIDGVMRPDMKWKIE